MDENFFKEKKETMEEQQQEQVEVEKVKVGEDEYTQEELSQLVGLGKIGQEAEEKFNVSLDKVWPNHQRTINEKKELEEKVRVFEEAQAKAEEEQNQEFTPELREKARKQLNELLGDEPVTKKSLDEYYLSRRNGEKLIDQTQEYISKAEADGLPKTNVEDLLKFMDEQGIRNPEFAYKMKFEKEIESIKEAKLSAIKKPGIVTNQTSNAGSKQPEPVKITRDNLNVLLREKVALE